MKYIVQIFGGLGLLFMLSMCVQAGVLSSQDIERRNADGKGSSSSYYGAQDRADDGWGNGTRSSNRKSERRPSATTQKVWVNKDGVIFEEEDVKALDRSEYE